MRLSAQRIASWRWLGKGLVWTVWQRRLAVCLSGMILAATGAVLPVMGQASSPKAGEALAFRHSTTGTMTRLVFELSDELPFHIFTLATPPRIVIDVPQIELSALQDRLIGGDGPIEAIRFGLVRPGVTRFVIDLRMPFQVQNQLVLAPTADIGYRLVIDIATSRTMGTLYNKRSPGWAGFLESLEIKNRLGNESGASQVAAGDSKKLIVLDPGHGGPDPGAIGLRKTVEKKIVLNAARLVAKRLEATGRYRVLLTRNDDVYIRLRSRAALAEHQEADLFISIHADALDRVSPRGASIYTLSRKASDREAARLAASENRSDLLAGIDGNPTVSDHDIQLVLLDMIQQGTLNASIRFARTVVETLNRHDIRTLENPHRFAGFVVLKSPEVPSVLIELGFLTNRDDERLLNDPAWLRRFANALTDAIDRYFATQPQ
ncbi:MAG: N-acetylmuramoyl-L-alanine amidase [Pseudomonadota bacterium]